MARNYVTAIIIGILVQFGDVSGQCENQNMSYAVGANEDTITHTWQFDNSALVSRIGDTTLMPNVTDGNRFTAIFPIGTTTVSVFTSSTEVLCSFQITVTDTHPPIIMGCPSGTLNFSQSEKVSWTTPTVTDNSGSWSLTQSGLNQDAEFPVGTTLIVYEARDPSGNTANCSFIISVASQSNAPIIINCPVSPLRVNADMGESRQVVTWTEPTADPSGPSATSSSNIRPGSEFGLGATYVLYNFTSVLDPSIQTECSFYVIVSPFVDTEPPVVTCPNNIMVIGGLNSESTRVTWESIPPTDNVAVVASFFIPQNGSAFGIGTTTVLFSAQDEAFNQADCTFNVTVLENRDNIKPVFRNCPQDFAVYIPTGRQSDIVTWSPPTVFDLSDTTLTSTHTPPVELTRGSHMVTYTATDAASNTETCSFNIVVGSDNEDPVMDCNALSDRTEYVRQADMNIPIMVSWSEPSPLATDNSGRVSVVRTKTPGSLFLPGVNETVRYTATDGVGRTFSCSFAVAVIVDPAPVFQNCTDYRLTTDDDLNTASFILPIPVATDLDPENPNRAPGVTVPANIPITFPIGTTTLTWAATDSRGSVTQCVVSVVVDDGQAPRILGCPQDIEVTVENSTFRSALVNWVEPQVEENSGQNVTLRSTISPGSILRPGSYLVQYIAEDRSGNIASCDFNVTVRDLPGDTTNPSLHGCPSNMFTVSLPDLDYNVVEWIPPTATDNEDTNVELIASHTPNQRFFIGATTVTYTAIDDRNNRQVCTFDVVVEDNQNPVFENCPNNVFQYVNPDVTTTLIKFDDVVVTDNSGSVDRNENFQRRETVTNLPIQINLIATDPSGNQGMCVVVVTINRTTDVFTYPGQVVITEFRNQATVPANLANIQADLDDYFRCSDLANDYVGIRLLGNPSFNIMFEVSFYRGGNNNPYSERGRFISRTIETAFVTGLTGTPPRTVPVGNTVQTDSFQLDVCEFRGSFTLLSSNNGSALDVGQLEVANSVAELSLRKLIHEQLDRTYNGQGSFITSVVLRPFVRSTFEINGIIVNFVLVFEDTATVAPPTETFVQQLFEDRLRSDGTPGRTQLGTSTLYISSAVPYSLIKICSVGYCLNGGTCIVDDSFSPVCQCQLGFTGTQCATSPLTQGPPTTVSSGGGLSQGAIIGIVAGAVALLLLLLLLLCCCCFVFLSSQPKAGPLLARPIPYEEPVAYVAPRRPRAIAYSAPPPYVREEPFVEMLVPEPVPQSSIVSYPDYRAGPIIEEIDSYPAYKRPYLDPYF